MGLDLDTKTLDKNAQNLASGAFLDGISKVVQPHQILTTKRRTQSYSTGIKIGGGDVEAVILPKSLLEIWRVLELCVKHNKIIIMQAANTGVTAGSTPYGNDYDRDIVIINTLKVNKITLLNQGQQVLAFAGATLYQLEDKLDKIDRSPHSIIGSSCIGASIVGGICNNSGGNLVNRGPAYTELALFAQLDKTGALKLVNHLGIELGQNPEDILSNLENGQFDPDAIQSTSRQASDSEYQKRVRDIEAATPARFNADERRLYEASGSAGKLAVFAVRLDTFSKPKKEQVFYIGTNNPEELTKIRKDILTGFSDLPEMGEYMHRSYFNASEKYCKDTYLMIKFFGVGFLPKLWSLKKKVDGILNYIPLLPNSFSDRFLQISASILPAHLPKRMRDYRDKFEHHLVIKANDGVIEDVSSLLDDFKKNNQTTGSFFICTPKEAKAALLHRFVAGNASGRYNLMHKNKVGGLMPFDIALRRNDEDWHNILPQELHEQLAAPLCLSHFFCLVIHHDFVLKKGVDPTEFKARYLAHLDSRGAKYPAEHNVGHLYKAEENLRRFYRKLDPTNTFNAGVGKMSKNKHYVEN